MPKEVWEDSTLKFLDPCVKSGVFLREIAKRLFVGLELEIPNEDKRREHIFKNMLYGIGITELTSLVARRSLYYTKYADSKYSVFQFNNKDGNIVYYRCNHIFEPFDKCKICNINSKIERGENLENYAYPFLHDENIFKDMRFDVIVGNPPYQLDVGGSGADAVPIYHLFVEQAFRLKPRYVSMVIMSRWFAGGKKQLDQFRSNMLDSKNFIYLADFPKSQDIFPASVQIEGGISYFLWDRQYQGKCRVENYDNGQLVSSKNRYLGEHGDIFIRFNKALDILKKVKAQSDTFCDSMVLSSRPFGMRTNFKDYQEKVTKNSLNLLVRGVTLKYVDPKYVTKNNEYVGHHKVAVSGAYGIGNYPSQIIGKPTYLAPDTVCTETYQICGLFKTKKEAMNYKHYLETRFVRFLISLRKNTQHLTESRFKFVPSLTMNKQWTDDDLYKKFNITKKEQDFIETIVKEMRE